MIATATELANKGRLAAFAGREVLITGGLGFIGSNLALELADLGARVTILDALLEPYGGNLDNVAAIRDRVQIDFSDMRALERVEHAVRGKEFIFHLAGQMSHSDSMRDPMQDLGANAATTLHLAEACRRHNRAAHIVLASTRQVYGRVATLPVNEDQPAAPVDANGISKLAGEQYLLLYHKVHGLRSAILRLTNTYGPRQRLGDPRHGVAGFFIHQALHGQNIRLFDGGMQIRDFNHVDDVVQAMLLTALQEDCFGRVLNLGGPRAWTLRAFAEVLQTLCSCGIEAAPFPPRSKAIDIGDYWGDFSSLHRATGWSPRIGLEEGLAQTVAFWRARMQGEPDLPRLPQTHHDSARGTAAHSAA